MKQVVLFFVLISTVFAQSHAMQEGGSHSYNEIRVELGITTPLASDEEKTPVPSLAQIAHKSLIQTFEYFYGMCTDCSKELGIVLLPMVKNLADYLNSSKTNLARNSWKTESAYIETREKENQLRRKNSSVPSSFSDPTALD